MFQLSLRYGIVFKDALHMGWKFIELELVEAELSERLVEVRYLVVFGGVDHD